MADEIAHANTIRLTREGSRWAALIGPDPQRGLVAFGETALDAMHGMILKCARHGWVFDETWKPR